MSGEGLNLRSVLVAAGLGLLAYVVLFKERKASGPQGLPAAPATAPAAALPAQAPTSVVSGELRPIASGASYRLARDLRALVAPQTMLMEGVIEEGSAPPPYMAPQPGAGAVRIFSPGEEVFINDYDLKDGCFYAAETEDVGGKTVLIGYKRYYTGSPAKLHSSLLEGSEKTPDYDPYTGQAFSEHGRAIAQAMQNGHHVLVGSGGSSMEDYAHPAPQGHRHEGRAPLAAKLPPRAARQLRIR